ncbi:MAG: B12-binding domain-containing radical SAM protein [Limisphaerales bacterium]
MNEIASIQPALSTVPGTAGARKRILLITPENPEINRVRRRQFNNFTQITMPYLAGFIDEARYQIELVDEYNQRIPYERPVDLVAITVNTPNAPHCYRMAARFRSGGARVVMGGPHATLRPEEAAQHCDHLVVGEAEETWPRFLDEFHRGGARPRYTSDHAPSLQGLPIPRRDLIRRRHFTKGAVFATRGCPFACSYCNLKQIYHGGFRTRPAPEVVADIQSMGNRYFVFWDDNFFGDLDYAARLMTALKPLHRRWAAQVSIDRCADERLLQLAREAGCVYLFIGLESFSAASLASVNKGFNQVPRYAEIIQRIHRHGICVQAGVIFGFDTDGKDVFARTLDACESLGIDGVTVSVLTPLPGTRLYDEMQREGRLVTGDWAWFNGKTHVAFQPKQLTAEELFSGYMWFRRRFFSFRSMLKRMSVSRTNLVHNLLVNLGYKWSLRATARPELIPGSEPRRGDFVGTIFKAVCRLMFACRRT